MATVKVKFRPSTVADRPGTIVYVVTHRRIAKTVTTGYKVYPHEWDEEHARLLPPDNPERSAIIQTAILRMRSDMERMDAIIGNLGERRAGYSSDDVVAEFRRTGGEDTLFNFTERVIERLLQLKRVGTARNYRAALRSFKRFRGNMDLPMEEIDTILVEDYLAYLKSDRLMPNSVSFYIRIFRSVYNRAVGQELIEDTKPFRTVSTGMEKTLKRAIPIGEIRRIKRLDLMFRPDLEFARDMFLFLFLCRRMSFIDAAYLKKEDIRGGILTYRRQKTGQALHIKIIEPIRELVDRYSDRESPYLLPVITRPEDDVRRQYETALRRVNNALKTIAKKARLDVPLTTYVARHSWASIAKSKNIPVNVISDALGHDSIATTQIYLATIDASTIDKANELIVKDL